MIRAQLDAETLSRVRWAASPVYEAVGWLALAASGRRHPHLGDPGAAARFALRDRRVATTAALMEGGLRGRYMPDFVTPKPPRDPGSRPGAPFQAQLELIRSSPVDTIAEQLGKLSGQSSGRAKLDSTRLAAIVADGLTIFWRLALADRWPWLQARLDQAQDKHLVAIREGGMSEVLANLHPSVHWRDCCLEIDKPYTEEVFLQHTELVLVPSLMTWPRLAVQVCDPANAMIAFPVRHTATRASSPVPHALLGRGRTRVLQAASSGRSTSALSEELSMAASTVSHHLGVLLDTGLVTRSRQGHQVLYRRTPAADRLLNTVAVQPFGAHRESQPSRQPSTPRGSG